VLILVSKEIAVSFQSCEQAWLEDEAAILPMENEEQSQEHAHHFLFT
jgi:hypothetical protein